MKVKLFLDKRPEGTKLPNNTYGTQNYSDFFVNFSLTKTIDLIDYVNVYQDPFRTQIDRQLINPFFIELDFFSTIQNIENQDYTGISGKTQIFNLTINS